MRSPSRPKQPETQIQPEDPCTGTSPAAQRLSSTIRRREPGHRIQVAIERPRGPSRWSLGGNETKRDFINNQRKEMTMKTSRKLLGLLILPSLAPAVCVAACVAPKRTHCHLQEWWWNYDMI